MRHEDWNRVQETMVSTVLDVLGTAGLTVLRGGVISLAEARWARTLAVIGLGGGKLRGSVVLSVPTTLLERVHPTGARSVEDLADYLAELANLLLGSFKRRLLALGIAIEISTPITLSAGDLRLRSFGQLPTTHDFSIEDEHVYVVFDAVGEEATKVEPRPIEDVALDTGEVVLF